MFQNAKKNQVEESSFVIGPDSFGDLFFWGGGIQQYSLNVVIFEGIFHGKIVHCLGLVRLVIYNDAWDGYQP